MCGEMVFLIVLLEMNYFMYLTDSQTVEQKGNTVGYVQFLED